MKDKKGQIKIQEMAFVLLALALLAIIGFIFFMKFQTENIAKAGEEAKQNTAISLLDKIASMTELNCQKGEICIDEDKVGIIRNKNLGNLFQGLKKVEIKRIYPGGSDLTVWQSGSGQGNQSYSTFINLCRQEKLGNSVEWNCGIALLEVWIS